MMSDQEDRGRGRSLHELLGLLIYAGATLAMSYYTLHPEEARAVLARFTGRPPMPAHLARTERIVSDFRRELATWNHAGGQAGELEDG